MECIFCCFVLLFEIRDSLPVQRYEELLYVYYISVSFLFLSLNDRKEFLFIVFLKRLFDLTLFILRQNHRLTFYHGNIIVLHHSYESEHCAWCMPSSEINVFNSYVFFSKPFFTRVCVWNRSINNSSRKMIQDPVEKSNQSMDAPTKNITGRRIYRQMFEYNDVFGVNNSSTTIIVLCQKWS